MPSHLCLAILSSHTTYIVNTVSLLNSLGNECTTHPLFWKGYCTFLTCYCAHYVSHVGGVHFWMVIKVAGGGSITTMAKAKQLSLYIHVICLQLSC